jgi:hypothetical protein
MDHQVATRLSARARREQRGVGGAAHVGDGRLQRVCHVMVLVAHCRAAGDDECVNIWQLHP